MANARSMYFDSDKIPRRILARVLHQVIAVTEADLDDLIDGAAKDIVVLNAGAALYAANVAPTMQAGVVQARAALDSGAARVRLDQLVALTQALKPAA